MTERLTAETVFSAWPLPKRIVRALVERGHEVRAVDTAASAKAAAAISSRVTNGSSAASTRTEPRLACGASTGADRRPSRQPAAGRRPPGTGALSANRC